MTLEGTNTYVVGRDPAYVIDPGPAVPEHVEAVRAAAEERGGIGGVLLTHSHADHSEAVPTLGAPLLVGEVSEGDETGGTGGAVLPKGRPATSSEHSARDTAVLSQGRSTTSKQDGDRDLGPFTALPSPGHAADHLCFTWEHATADPTGTGASGPVVFCGDLILGHGSSIVPPRAMGGSLAEYMGSLERVRGLGAELLCPGHGPWITDPAAKIDEYVAHRREREAKLVAALEAGERSRDGLLDAAWDDVPAPLRGAAALAMQAHLEKLEDEGRLPEGIEPTQPPPNVG